MAASSPQRLSLGYLILTPRRHVPGFAGLSDDEAGEIGQWITRLSRALKSLAAERVYVAVVGQPAGSDVCRVGTCVWFR